MDPFDPSWDLETLIDHLNREHRPGSLTSGKTRNALIRAWAVVAGRAVATVQLRQLIEKHGSKARVAKNLMFSPSTLVELEGFFESVPRRGFLPSTASSLRGSFRSMDRRAKAKVISLALELAGESGLVAALSGRDGGVRAVVASALRISVLRAAVHQLESNLTRGVTAEAVYQDWCERHSWAFGNAYVVRDTVRAIDRSNVTDLLLPNLMGYRDIVELKRPDHRVLGWDAGHRSHYFAAACSRAIGQVHKYMDRLHDLARDGLPRHPELIAYHPRAFIVIGRSASWSEPKGRDLRGLNERLHGVTVLTYDHLLLQAKQLLATIDPTESPHVLPVRQPSEARRHPVIHPAL